MNTNNPLPSAITHEVDYLVALAESLKDDPMKPLSEVDRARTDGDLFLFMAYEKKMVSNDLGNDYG